MKNIKTFESYIKLYEELKSTTYYSASKKLNEFGHLKRGSKLEIYSELKSREETRAEYSKYGTIEIDVVNLKDDSLTTKIECYVLLDFSLIDDEDDPLLMISVIPTNESYFEKINKYIVSDIDERFHGFGIFEYRNLNKHKYFSFYDDSDDFNLELSNRASAVKLKNLMVNVFQDDIPDYPYFNHVTDEAREDMLEIVNNLPINKMCKN